MIKINQKTNEAKFTLYLIRSQKMIWYFGLRTINSNLINKVRLNQSKLKEGNLTWIFIIP